MKIEKLVGERYKERPSDCMIDSHALMIRGGYMKNVGNGIYSSLLPLKRITHKIEQIIREEMDGIEGQEVQFPVVMPATLWQESGRYESIGNELIRFRDRNNSALVLGMTHEEAAVQLVREYAQSYVKYPFMVYQIQTKFRDEARPRGGLIRVREFTMKDAYSFHTNQHDLEDYYDRCFHAYKRIFEKVGIPEVISVASDSGMMGGKISHEFMLLTPIGEDSIVICKSCNYRANMEAADHVVCSERDKFSKKITLVHTPGVGSMEKACDYFGIANDNVCKAEVFQRMDDESYIVVFLRGDLEVNETKLTRHLGAEIHTAVIPAEREWKAENIGPYGLKVNCHVLYDQSLKNANNLVCGGNLKEHYFTGLDMQRDIENSSFYDLTKIQEGSICPCCGKRTITISRGVEVGNIFQLGIKYTQAMNMTYVDREGDRQFPLMGCYGIGIGRLAASVCEAHHDDFGPIWPKSIAPWQIHICAVRSDDEDVKESANALYQDLLRSGIEVLIDDREVRAGVMFSEADLLGVPWRIMISPRTLEEHCCEIVSRDKSISMKVPMDCAKEKILELV